MDKNDNGDFNYVQEKVKPKTKKRIRKALIIAVVTLVAAVVFGFVARLVFVASEGAVNKLLGVTPIPAVEPGPVTQDPRSEVKLGSNTTSPTATPSPSPEPSASTKPTEPVEVLTPSPVQPSPTEPITPVPIAADPADKQETDGSESSDTESPLTAYLKMMSELKTVADTASKSIIRVYSVTTGINWMDESIETRTERTGVIMADNGIELLVLTDYAPLAGADRIELQFTDSVVLEADLYSYDADTGFAIVAVSLENIPEKVKESYSYAIISHDAFYEGQPIIALGRPNGYFGAVEYGFITHTGTTVYTVDGVESGFTTDLVCGAESDAVIISLDGTMLGVIKPSDTDATDISSFTLLLERLLNRAPISYFGIRAENVPENILTGLGLTNGIYVNEAIALSPAADAGLKKGDIITAIDDTQISTVREFYEYILTTDPDTLVTVHICRSSKREDPNESIIITLGRK